MAGAAEYGTNSTTNLVSTVIHRGPNNTTRLPFVYTYDSRGNIISEARKGVMTYYTYDGLGQLVREDNNHTAMTTIFAYDRGGNLLSKTMYSYGRGAVETLGNPLGTYVYTYDSVWKDKLMCVNSRPLNYDAIGNLKSDLTWTYVWQHGRQLAVMENSAQKIEFKYDHNGMRVEKKVTNKGDNSVETTRYYYQGKRLVRQHRGNHVLHFYYDAEGRPAMVMHNGTMYTYAHSYQGDIAAIVDSAGNLVVEYKYDAWGNITHMFGSLASTLGEMNPFRYRGYVYDVESGLYYLRSRYYNPEWGRFINADTVLGKVGALGTHNLFAYCANNPVMCVDHSGHSLLVVAACLFLYVLCQNGESGQSDTSTNSQSSQQDSFPFSSALSTARMKFLDWYWSLKGVYFEPNAGYANGGQITNAAKLTYKEMVLYVKYLNEKYGSIYQGSTEGFFFEWQIHCIGYTLFSLLGKTEEAEAALHYDFGATIYDDDHSFTPHMLYLFGMYYPEENLNDYSIHLSHLSNQ